jgi:polysaccharide export outer membrane protein
LIRAAGLTVGELEAAITERLRPYVLDPQVSVSIMEFRSEPISILGCVKNPGIYQLQGQKNLAEALSMAGGLDPAAGAMVKVTRERSRGPIPVFGALVDDTGKYTVAEISLTSILKADNPRDNIAIMAHDIITVPRAEMVYVMGNVQRAGGFPLTDGKSVSLLQALSLAGGLDHAASPKHSYLLRTASGSKDRDHIAVDLTKVISGQAEDMAMLPGDILFVPNNVPKQAILRGVEAAIQIGTGVAVYGRY